MVPAYTRFFARVAIVAVLVAAAGLTGCGRRGPLEAPPGAAAATGPTDPSAQHDPGLQKPDRPFILDPLL